MQIWLMGLGDRVKKYFGFIYFVIVIIGMVWLFNYLSPTSRKIRMLEKLSKEYGGVYVFYPEFREEIKKRERKRKEYMDKFFEKQDVFTKNDLAKLDSILPQTLSNGCKYHNQAFGPYREYFEPYYEKIKEFVGEEVYEKLKPSFRTTSFYECGDGKKVMITIYTAIGTTKREFGIFGDEGRGFFLSKRVGVDIGGSNTFELRDGKFEKMNKKSGGLR